MPPMRPPNVRACVEVSHRLTLEGHYGGVLIFLSSSVRAFVELVVCLAFPFMTSSVRLSFAAAHFSCGRISCSQSDQSGKHFFLQAKKHPLASRCFYRQVATSRCLVEPDASARPAGAGKQPAKARARGHRERGAPDVVVTRQRTSARQRQ